MTSRQEAWLPGAAVFARTCEFGGLSLTLEPHMPRWPPFKEQLIVSNASPKHSHRRPLSVDHRLPAEWRVAAARRAGSF
jgi:hypothetical protein